MCGPGYWFWLIPLTDGVTSIGAVCWPYYLKSRTKPLPEFFRDTIALCPALAERLADAKLVSEVHATGNYSYSSRISSGEQAGGHTSIGTVTASVRRDPTSRRHGHSCSRSHL